MSASIWLRARMLILPGTDSQQYFQALPCMSMSHLSHSQDLVTGNQ